MPTTSHARQRRIARATVVTLAVASMVALAGCSAQGGSVSADGTTQLKVYGWKGGGTELANVAEVNAAFEKANPGVKVDFEYIPSTTYAQRVQPELLSGKSADVLMTDSSKVNTWGTAGYLEDLSSQSWTGSVLPTVNPFITNDSKVYAAPMELIGISLYANNTLLKKAGVDTVPTTWPEFKADLQKVKDAGISPIALPNKGGWTGEAALNAIAASLVYQKNKDWDANFLAKKADFSDWSSSVSQLMSLQDSGFVDYKEALGVDEWSQGLTDFTAGKSAFYFQGAWNQSAVTAAGVDAQFIPWPATSDKAAPPTANLFAGTMLSVNAKSTVKSAAEKYVDFWADAKNAAPFLAAENAIAPYTGATSPSTPATKTFVDTVETGNYRVLPSNSWLNATNEAQMQKQMQSLMLGQITQQQFLDQMNQLH